MALVRRNNKTCQSCQELIILQLIVLLTAACNHVEEHSLLYAGLFPSIVYSLWSMYIFISEVGIFVLCEY